MKEAFKAHAKHYIEAIIRATTALRVSSDYLLNQSKEAVESILLMIYIVS